jgi:hypothetical protein
MLRVCVFVQDVDSLVHACSLLLGSQQSRYVHEKIEPALEAIAKGTLDILPDGVAYLKLRRDVTLKYVHLLSYHSFLAAIRILFEKNKQKYQACLFRSAQLASMQWY